MLDEVIESTRDVNLVKSLTRAGMGLCQGRNCQRQIAALVAERHGQPLADVAPTTARLPARPVALGQIARVPDEDLGRFQ
jgi:hypothetical protein